ncbi:MAG: hypothetical protein IPJ71_01540 [Bdellovibrionales bacterium]|nr:hypothetical protein [Bdellovibrionales bacterium]
MGRAAVAMLARHQDVARELLLEHLSVEEFRIPVTEMDLNAQVRATDAMFVPIRLETQGPAHPLAMWDPPLVMRILPRLMSALHPVPVAVSQTVPVHLQGRPAVRFLGRLAPRIVALLAGVPADFSDLFSRSKMT